MPVITPRVGADTQAKWALAVAEATAAVAAFEASVAPGLASFSNFSMGATPFAWACADPSQLSCRLL